MTRMLLQTTCPGSPLIRYRQGIVAAGVLGGLVLAATAGYSYGSSGDDSKPSLDSKATTTEKNAKKAKKEAEPVVAQKMELPAVKLDALALAQHIDQAIGARMAEEKVQPAALADDAEFLRRVYLDIMGVIPTVDQAVAFLDSKDPNKRVRLIDELLASPQYGRHMADMWQSYLVPRTSDNRRLQPAPLIRWLEENFNNNKPWNQFVTELLTAAGSQDQNGAVTFYLANQTSDKYTDTVCRLFLGVQLQCAQCHNHPFTGWKQDEYWGMAAFFSKVRPDRLRNAAAGGGNSPGVSESGQGRARLPDSAKVVPAKFLLGEQPKIEKDAPYRPVLANWLTAPDNPFFARAMANRIWSQFFGRGIVNPVDDMHDGNVPSHPQLLQELAGQFAVNNFDVKYLIRAVCNSQTYQRTSRSNGDDAEESLFSRMAVKVMSPEQLYDSLRVVVTPSAKPEDEKAAAVANQGRRGAGNARAQFVAFFQSDDGADPTEYQAGIPQALRLMNSAEFIGGDKWVNGIIGAGQSPKQNIERLYLGAVSRRPNAEENQRLATYISTHSDEPRKAYSDIAWALLNSSEFTLNH